MLLNCAVADREERDRMQNSTIHSRKQKLILAYAEHYGCNFRGFDGDMKTFIKNLRKVLKYKVTQKDKDKSQDEINLDIDAKLTTELSDENNNETPSN